jgi:alpha-L-fucosidase
MEKFNDGRDWFFNKRFGLFIHWGLYSIPAWHEQVLWRKNMQRNEYEKLVNEFNPVNFDPEKWLDIIQDAGMEYICFTTKHHEGFCMWDTKQTDYNIMNTPYKKDILGMLADACHKRNFPLCLYYSIVDWHHPNYPNYGRSHELEKQPEDSPHMEKYIEYLKAQLTELCSNYGEIHGIWWDINSSNHKDPEIHDIIRKLQPKAVINDRGFMTGVRGIDNGDFTTPERELPAGKKFTVPTEACESICIDSWGYKEEANFYSDKYLMECIDKTLSMGGNYLLNVGPMPDGNFEDKAKIILKNIGSWFNKVRSSYDAQPKPEFYNGEDIYITAKENTMFLHINPTAKATALPLPSIKVAPRKAVLLNTGEELKFTVDSGTSAYMHAKKYLTIKNIPANENTEEILVIKVEFDNPL